MKGCILGTALLSALVLQSAAAQSVDEAGDHRSRTHLHGIALALGSCDHHNCLFTAILNSDTPDRMRMLQGELHVTSKEILKLEAFASRRREDVLLFNGSSISSSPMVTLVEQMDQAEEYLLANLPKAWDKNQEKRFEELCCQFSGPMALRFKHYATKLGLPDQKRVKVKELLAEYNARSLPLHGAIFTAATNKAARGPWRKLSALALQLDKNILELLTDKQRTQWKSMLGKEIDWTKVFPSVEQISD